MPPIKKLKDVIELVKSQKTKRVVVAYGQDEMSVLASKKAIDLGLADVTLVGDSNIIKQACKATNVDHKLFKIVDEPDEMESGRLAIDIINSGEGDVLMKGLISTDKLLRCILDKERGLMIPGMTLSHISVAEVKTYRKLLIFTDAAFIPTPTIQQKIIMTQYVINTARKLGIKRPKIALISYSEKTNPKVQSIIDAAIIAKMAERGEFKDADVDGPLSIDTAVDPDSVRAKGLKSCVEGNADGLVFPYLVVGNVFYKALTYFAKAAMATYIVGTKAPTAISSRNDTEMNKLYSVAFACLMAEKDVEEEE
ncbi:MAG TPA: hypothetical protein ENG70_05395 [Candidatus Cloacimonetes bacterium]|nr:hypothetical protein [Candidatus Cloacimonadota bacterium]HEX38271.1 hypothetical protein [Candidatus Cloacimonadota bacterium]